MNLLSIPDWRHLLMACALGGPLLLAGCGGGDSASEEAAQPALPTLAPPTVDQAKSATSEGRKQIAATLLDSQTVVDRGPHVATWGYFRDPSLARWYIAAAVGGRQDVFSLGDMVNRRESWWRVGSEATFVDNRSMTAQTNAGLQTWASTSAFWALTAGDWKPMVDSRITADRTRIQGTQVPVDWYFFNAGLSWYIVNTDLSKSSGQPVVYKFAVNSAGTDYDWQAVNLEGASVKLAAVPGGMRVSFTRPTRFVWPTALPAGVTLATAPDPGSVYNTGGYGFLQDTSNETAYPICAATRVRVSNHPGIDINVLGTTGNGDAGTPILAVADGVVTDVAPTLGAVAIRHQMADGTSVWSSSMHMRAISVAVGNTVRAGQQIGEMSSTGGNFFAHLHFELRTESHPDPGNASAWCVYSAQSLNTLRSWLIDPFPFLKANSR